MFSVETMRAAWAFASAIVASASERAYETSAVASSFARERVRSASSSASARI